MWAVILQILAVAVGWQIVRQLPWTWRRGEALAASATIGFVVAAWAYFVFALIFGWSAALPVVSGILAIAVIMSQWRLKRRAKLTSTPYIPTGGWRRWLVWASVTASTLVIIYLAFLSYQFPTAGGAWISNGNVWGDGPVHISFTNQFAHGESVDLLSPLYNKVPLSYPFMVDFWSGVLMRLTDSWIIGFTIPSVVMILALLQLLFSFGYRLLGSARAAWLAWLMFVFSGSLYAGVKLTGLLLTKGIVAYDAAVGVSIVGVTGDGYLNFIHSHLLPQRAYLLGMALFIIIMTGMLELFRHYHAKKRQTTRWLFPALIIGLLGGLLPLVHTHSYMVLIGLLTLSTAGWWIIDRTPPKEWWIMLGTIIVVAIPQFIWQFGTTYYRGFGHWIFGWTTNLQAESHDFWLWFWLSSTGFLFIMIIFGWYWLWRQKVKPEIWLFYIAGVAIFIIANIYVFQPTYWDNMKFFGYSMWFTMLACSVVLASWSRRIVGAVIVFVIMTSLTIMGFYTLVLSGPKLTFELLSAADVRFGNELQNRLPDTALVLVSNRHNSPVTMLGGKKVLVSYSGWYNLYGREWSQTLQDRDTMLSGKIGAEALISQYRLTHAVFSDAEISSGQVQQSFFDDRYKLLVHENGWWVYDLQQSAS